jgi:hypothetical protein
MNSFTKITVKVRSNAIIACHAIVLLLFPFITILGQPIFPSYSLTNFVNNVTIRPVSHPTADANFITNNPQMNTAWANIGYHLSSDKLLLTWNQGIFNGAGNDIMIVCLDRFVSGTADVRLLLADNTYTQSLTLNFTTGMIESPNSVEVRFYNYFTDYGNTIYSAAYHPAGKAIDIASFYSGSLMIKGIEFTNTTNIYLDLIAVAATQNAVLPIKIEYFNVSNFGGLPTLSWKIAYQMNASQIEIERSTDGTRFSKIGTIHLIPDFYVPYNISFTDSSALKNEKYFYRLKMVDLNHTYSFSDIKTFRYQKEDKPGIFVSFDPITNNILLIGTPVNKNYSLQTIYGQVVRKGLLTNRITNLDIKGLPHGIYLFVTENYSVTKIFF